MDRSETLTMFGLDSNYLLCDSVKIILDMSITSLVLVNSIIN
ncbi:hypothetical protein J2Z58_003792 [Halobacillus andaensis]|nr:hypothetical protein [Halobacillus andaensis]